MATSFGGRFDGLTVLVTGHTGFKGSWTCIWLRQLGAEVVGYSRALEINPRTRNFQLTGLQSRMTSYWGDIRDLERLLEVMDRCQPQLVIHMAAQPIVRVGYQQPLETFDTNVRGTLAVLEAIRRTRHVRVLISVTSDKVYRDMAWTWGYRENDRLGGYDPYSGSKAMAELAIESMRSSWDESWQADGATARFADHPAVICAVRAGNVIGGGDFSPYRLVPDLFAALLADRPFLLRHPHAVRPWQHVLEPLSGYLMLAAAALEDGGPYAGAWNFGPRADESVTCQTLAQRLIERWGSGRIETANEAVQAHETCVLRLNCDQARQLLRWRPTWNWETTAEQIVNWYRAYAPRQDQPHSAAILAECVQQIERYTEHARSSGIAWATG